MHLDFGVATLDLNTKDLIVQKKDLILQILQRPKPAKDLYYKDLILQKF